LKDWGELKLYSKKGKIIRLKKTTRRTWRHIGRRRGWRKKKKTAKWGGKVSTLGLYRKMGGRGSLYAETTRR